MATTFEDDVKSWEDALIGWHVSEDPVLGRYDSGLGMAINLIASIENGSEDIRHRPVGGCSIGRIIRDAIRSEAARAIALERQLFNALEEGRALREKLDRARRNVGRAYGVIRALETE